MALIALLSHNPEITLKRFMVKSLSHCKDLQQSNPQHELIIVEVVDVQQSNAKALFMLLERTASEECRALHHRNKSTAPDEGSTSNYGENDSSTVMNGPLILLNRPTPDPAFLIPRIS
jgi:hypothetical protein